MKPTAHILGPVLAASLALSPFAAAPAHAGNDDFAKVLFGLAALTVIGAALADNDPAPAAPQVHVHRTPPAKNYTVAPRVVRRLPSECRLKVHIQGKPRTVYGKACMKRNTSHTRLIPQSCERTINAFGRQTAVYFRNCLKDHGWHS